MGQTGERESALLDFLLFALHPFGRSDPNAVYLPQIHGPAGPPAVEPFFKGAELKKQKELAQKAAELRRQLRVPVGPVFTLDDPFTEGPVKQTELTPEQEFLMRVKAT